MPPQYYNDMADAQAMVANCPERVHEDPTLAGVGKMQYEVTLTEEMWSKTKAESSSVRCEANLDAEVVEAFEGWTYRVF